MRITRATQMASDAARTSTAGVNMDQMSSEASSGAMMTARNILERERRRPVRDGATGVTGVIVEKSGRLVGPGSSGSPGGAERPHDRHAAPTLRGRPQSHTSILTVFRLTRASRQWPVSASPRAAASHPHMTIPPVPAPLLAHR